MPAYNTELYIAQAIESIIAQTHTNWELLIADDGSKDNTKAIIAQYNYDSRIKTFHNEKNIGYHNTCNKLLALCKGDYLTFLDADDYCPNNRLRLQLQAFENNPNLGMVGTSYEAVDMEGNFIHYKKKPTSYAEVLATMPNENAFCGATMMFTRAIYNEFGGYRAFFQKYAYEDYDLAYRICDKYECFNLEEPLYSYRQNISSISKRISLSNYLCAQIVQYLAQQRAQFGKDDLDNNNIAALEAKFEELKQPYNLDSSLIYRKYAGYFMYAKLYKSAIHASWQAIKHNPLKLDNYRTFLYCLRKGSFATAKSGAL